MFLLGACAATPTVEYDPKTSVPISLVEDLQFSDTSQLSIDDCKARFTDITEPLRITEGDVVAADFVLYIDLDPVYRGWEQFAMDDLCVKGNWGVFRTTGIVEIPTDAEVWSINQEA